MEHNSQSGDFVIDIESCRAKNELLGSPDPSIDTKLGRSFSAEVLGGFVNVDCENGLNVISNETNGGEGTPDNVKVLINKEECVKGEEVVASRTRNERRKSPSAKKPPKPPRPPRGCSLDAADQKLIREITELAMLKRARIERMKALEKKMKAAKASSASNSKGSFFAMFFSILFFLLIVYHGMSCSSSSTSQFHGSPEATGSVENLIMAQHRQGFSSNGIYSITSESPKLVEQISGSIPLNKLTMSSG